MTQRADTDFRGHPPDNTICSKNVFSIRNLNQNFFLKCMKINAWRIVSTGPDLSRPEPPDRGAQPFWGTPLTPSNAKMFKEKSKKFLFVSAVTTLVPPASCFQTLEYSISYNIPSNRPCEKRRKCAFNNPHTVCLRKYKSLMTFKALL